MRLVGLTGGIATGKSSFARALRDLGTPVIDADQLARAAVARGTPALQEISRALGPEAVGPDGELDRKRVATLVFADPAARARLEAIVHPAVREAARAEAERLAAQGHALAFYDVPLLFEARAESRFDLTAFCGRHGENSSGRVGQLAVPDRQHLDIAHSLLADHDKVRRGLPVEAEFR